VITVTFLDGDEGLKTRVRDSAWQWVSPCLANLQFAFVDSAHADVCISIRPGNGSWSTIGTTCRNVPNGLPTMNFRWLDASCSEQELRADEAQCFMGRTEFVVGSDRPGFPRSLLLGS
jgi:serralysin